MTAEERIATLEAQLSQVLEQLRLTQEELRQAHEQLAVAHKRIEELEKQKTPPPAFVKANVKKRQDDQKKPRKKRDPKHNRARRLEEPTQIIEHLITACPVCSSRLGGVSVARRRQVIELPPPILATWIIRSKISTSRRRKIVVPCLQTQKGRCRIRRRR